jgi:multimeric flavodoxin WrbA
MPKYDDLRALYVNCTLKKTPETSNTQALMDRSIALLEEQGAHVESLRLVDFQVADGMSPDMRQEGWTEDAWPDVIWPKVRDADILVVGTSLWIGEPTSVSRRLVERLYAMTDETNDKGQPIFYGKVAGTVTTGNEDGVKNAGSTSASRSRRPPRRDGSGRSAPDRRTSTRARAAPRTSSRRRR